MPTSSNELNPMNLKIVFAVLFAAVTTVQGQDPIPAKESRAKAEKLRGQGNWKDALKIGRASCRERV